MRFLWIFILSFLALPTLVQAQEGPFIGIRSGYNIFSFDDTQYSSTDDKGRGPGIGLEFGYVFNPVVTLFVSVNGYSLNSGDSRILNALLGGRARFLEQTLSPYFELVAGGAMFNYISDSNDPLFTGQQVGAGAGLDVWIGRNFGLNAGVRAQRFWINKSRLDGEVSDLSAVKTFQFQPTFGFSFYF